MTMKVLSLLAGLCMMAATLAAAGVDGKWDAKVPTPVGERQYVFLFKADGESLTGTVSGGRGGEATIQEGKVKGDAISFKHQISLNDRQITFVYSGKLAGDSIEFTRKAEGGGAPGGDSTFTATRAK
jgi:hypothetical protein